MLLEMMNHDGITVIDMSGKIRGYNLFISKKVTKPLSVEGGARKRAAYSILDTGDEKIMGVYFQSQDGNSFYKRMV